MFNLFGYKSHQEAVIISCYFNPENSPYRLKAFKKWYKSIKHLNHRIIECVIGEGKSQLPKSKYIEVIYTESLLWHKETLLNKIVKDLDQKYKYVFWVDADVLFTNKRWLVDGVKKLQHANLIQPFEYCVHLEKNETKPGFNLDSEISILNSSYQQGNRDLISKRHPKLWRSFCSNNNSFFSETSPNANNNYDFHGHVGFAWGARRGILDKCPLYDRALIGGADHIIAHAAAGHIPHNCITKSFKDNIEEIETWSHKFYTLVKGKIDYVEGNLYHLWHGDIKKRQYLKRIQDFTKQNKSITEKDNNGLYVSKNQYIKDYFREREVVEDNSFISSIIYGYLTNYTLFGWMLGGNPIGAAIGDSLNNSEDHQNNENFS